MVMMTLKTLYHLELRVISICSGKELHITSSTIKNLNVVPSKFIPYSIGKCSHRQTDAIIAHARQGLINYPTNIYVYT